MIFSCAKWTGLAGLIIGLSACGGGTNETNNEAETSSVSMQYDMTGFLSQTVDSPTARSLARAFTSEQILRGELSATTIGGDNNGVVETFVWTIYMDEATLDAESNLTLDLVPGNYDFELLVADGNQQYAGYANFNIIDGTNDVPLTVKPIIGDVVIDVTTIDELADFQFQYDASELSGLTAPSIGIQIDLNAEQIFTINPATGMSDSFVNLPEGQHDLLLRLYDANVQVGKSIVEQQTKTVTSGLDLAMDIIPLHGETQFLLTEDGGDANVTVNIPLDVVNEVGGVDNLIGVLAMVGTKNPLQESDLSFIEQVDGSFQASLVLTDLQYEDVTLALTFSDKTTNDQIADCTNTWTLNDLDQTFICSISLIRRAVVTGSIMSVLGINVLNEAGEPAAGVVITDQNDNVLGLTGSGVYGTAGYIKVYLSAGDYDITATDATNNQADTESISLSALEVENVLFELSVNINSNFERTGPNGNLALIGTNGVTAARITASSQSGNYTPEGAFDGYSLYSTPGVLEKINPDAQEPVDQGVWFSGSGMDSWIQVEFENPVNISGFRIVNTVNYELSMPKDVILQTSMDGIDFTDHESFTLNQVQDQTISLSTSVSSKFIRLHILRNFGQGDINIDELEIF